MATKQNKTKAKKKIKSDAVDVLLPLSGYYPWIIIKKGNGGRGFLPSFEDYVVTGSTSKSFFGRTYFSMSRKQNAWAINDIPTAHAKFIGTHTQWMIFVDNTVWMFAKKKNNNNDNNNFGLGSTLYVHAGG